MRMIRRRFHLLAGCLLSVLIGAVVGGTASARSPYFDWKYEDVDFNPPVPERFVLDNGLIVHFLPDSHLPVVTVQAIIHTGEVYVPDGKAGLAGIAGRVLVTGGTEQRTPEDLDNSLEFLGIRLNGSIADESGSFSLRCLSKDLDTGFTILAELLQNPRFDSAKFQLAVDDALESWRRRNDSPRQITSREFARLVYGDHPYGRTPDRRTLNSLTRSDVIAFYRRYFAPNNTILAVSGDLTRSRLEVLLEAHFGDWDRSETISLTPPPPPTDQSTGVYQIMKDINQTNIRFGHLGVDRKNPDRHALRVLNHILGGGGFTSRMMMRVRSDSGWAYSVGTAFSMKNQPGLFLASCQTKAENTTKVLGLMQWVIDDLLEHGITDDELATAKESILNSDVFSYVTPSQIVNTYAWLEYHGFPPDQMKKNVEAIRAVTKSDVNAAARKYLHPDRYTILAVGPIDSFDAPLTKFGTPRTLSLEDSP